MAASTDFSSFFVGVSVASLISLLTFDGLSSGWLPFSSDPGLVVLTLGTPLSIC